MENQIRSDFFKVMVDVDLIDSKDSWHSFCTLSYTLLSD